MTEANPADPVDLMVIEELADHSLLRVIDLIPFNLPPHSTQPKETPQSTLEPIRMNVDVVDDTMQDLDPFSLAPKALVLCPQPLAVQEVSDFPDSSQVPTDNTFDDRDSDSNEPELNFDLLEGLASKTVNEEVIDLDPVPQRRSSAKCGIRPIWGRRRRRSNCHGPLMLLLTWVLHRPPKIHEVRTKKGQAPQRGARRALAGRIRREPLWQDQSNPAEVISRNREENT